MKTVSLAYSTREINRNFRIKVSGVDGEGNKGSQAGWRFRGYRSYRC